MIHAAIDYLMLAGIRDNLFSLKGVVQRRIGKPDASGLPSTVRGGTHMQRLCTPLIAAMAMETLAWGSAPHGVIAGPNGGLNVIVRVDRQTQEFQPFPSDRSNAHVRQMLGRTGEGCGAESGVDRLLVITATKAGR
jgi:streptogramin lyase